MGHKDELVKSIANSIDLDIEFESVTNIEELNRKIRNGEADLIAYPLDRARDIENFNYTFCGPERITKQVLIQRKEKGKTDINEISDLIGKEVYVEKGSKFESRLINLNSELGGGIIIRSVHRDSISSEDLIRDVAEGKIDFPICDDNIACLNQNFFRYIHFQVPVKIV